MKLHLCYGFESKCPISRCTGPGRAPTRRAQRRGGGSPFTQETSLEPGAGQRAAGTTSSASLHAAGSATAPSRPERTQDSVASPETFGPGRLQALGGSSGDSQPLGLAPDTRHALPGRWAGREGWRRSGGWGAAGSRPRGRDREVPEPGA